MHYRDDNPKELSQMTGEELAERGKMLTGVCWDHFQARQKAEEAKDEADRQYGIFRYRLALVTIEQDARAATLRLLQDDENAVASRALLKRLVDVGMDGTVTATPAESALLVELKCALQCDPPQRACATVTRTGIQTHKLIGSKAK